MLAMERQPGSLYARESDRLRIFALKGSDAIGADIARLLSRSLDAHEEREFEDGEHKARPLAPVCGADVYVIDSLHGDPDRSANDKLCRLLFFIGALKDAGAARVTAVVPYLCYSRKDRRTKTSDPVTTRYVATLFDAIGADVVVHDRSPQRCGLRECVPASRDRANRRAAVDRGHQVDGGRRTTVRDFTGPGRRQAR